MKDLAALLTEANQAAFTANGLDPASADVQRSNRPDLGEFQANGALAVAKAVGKKPQEIAQSVAASWAATELAPTPTIAGPGFLNFNVTADALAKRAQAIADDPRTGASTVETPRRVVVDYGGPNVAKGMHVGHLRASIIGESLKRLFRYRGDQVWGDAHFGDWGFQMGLMIATIEDKILREANWVDGQLSQADIDNALAAVDLDWLQEEYPAAAARVRADEKFRDLARNRTAMLQSGNSQYVQIWRHMRKVSMEAQKRDFASLGVDFDLWLGESDADKYMGGMIDDLDAKNLLENDQGARILRVAKPGETKKKKLDDGTVVEVETPDPLIVVSSEGSAMYGATDLATIVQRERDFQPDLYLYTVDQRQADHFEQVFRAAARAGYAKREALEHLGFGTMNGEDGKPFKTRAGGVLKLGDLIGQAEEKARAKMREVGVGEEYPPAEFEDVAHKVAIAAIKFADLSNFRGTSYKFDLDRFVSFEGKTGPYLLYQAVRIKSILRKAEEQGIASGPVQIAEDAERALALALDGFDAALRVAYDKRAPHFLAEHAYTLAQAFSGFYTNCPILPSEGAVRASRLTLAQATLKQLTQTLELLGIEVPERM